MKNGKDYKLVQVRIFAEPYEWFCGLLQSGKMTGVNWAGSYMSGLFKSSSVPFLCVSARLSYELDDDVKVEKTEHKFANNALLYVGDDMPYGTDAILVGQKHHVRRNDVGIWVSKRVWSTYQKGLIRDGLLDFEVTNETRQFAEILCCELKVPNLILEGRQL